MARDLSGPAMLTVVDPEAVAKAIQAGVGETVTLSVSARLDLLSNEPLTMTGQVRAVSDGRYVMKEGALRLADVNQGRTVLLHVRGISVVISEIVGPAVHPAVYRMVGLEPAEARVQVGLYVPRRVRPDLKGNDPGGQPWRVLTEPSSAQAALQVRPAPHLPTGRERDIPVVALAGRRRQQSGAAPTSGAPPIQRCPFSVPLVWRLTPPDRRLRGTRDQPPCPVETPIVVRSRLAWRGFPVPISH